MIKLISAVYNRPEYTKLFLDSIYEIDHGDLVWPVIVNNGSRKRTQVMLEEWQNKHDSLPSEIKDRIRRPDIIALGDNRGFAAAINAGLGEEFRGFSIPGKTCVIHNDTVLFPNWAKEMQACFAYDEDVAVVMPRTNYANEIGPCIPEHRKAFEAIKPSNKDRLEPEDLGKIMDKLYPEGKDKWVQSLQNAEPKVSYSVDIASFCMMFDYKIIQKYGRFDEDFFPRMYEDKFWFRPMQRDGLACFIANRAYVHHWGNITSDGPGMSFPETAKANEEKFKKKCAEADAKYFDRKG